MKASVCGSSRLLKSGVCALLCAMAGGQALHASVTPAALTVALRSAPVGIEQSSLRFGWQLRAVPVSARGERQSAYRIMLASSRAALASHRGDVWDSGRVESAEFWQRPYLGPRLQAHTQYFWAVQVWDGQGKGGAWSAPTTFTTGLLAPQDWTAHWIAARPEGAAAGPLPVFRHDFAVRKAVASALLFVSGLGQYEVHLNGGDVTDTVLNPGWTNYRKTVPYDTYDVTRLLHPGQNAFGVLLGNGMYNVQETKGRYGKFSGSFGQPKCLLQMEVRYADGSAETFVSDGSWRTHAGPVVFDSIYGGEDEDARALDTGWDKPGYAAADWTPAAEVAGPGGTLQAEVQSPMAIAERLKPVSVKKLSAGVTVYDLGKMMSGWPEIAVRGEAGAKVSLLPGELLASDGSVSQRSTNAFPDSAVLFDYTLRGGGSLESWHSRFSYHSFRYVQVTQTPAPGSTRLPEVVSVQGDFVHARVGIAGEFASSDKLYNRIHALIDRAVLSNLASVVTDCPSREKLGWLEQTYLNAGTLMLNYDVSGLYEKMSNDIVEAQLPSGLVPSIAPEYPVFGGPFRDSPEWGSAVVLSPWALYQYTGDRQPLEENYAAMQRYVAYLETKAKAGILNYGLGDWYDIGPKEPGPSQLTSLKVTATGTYFEDLVVLAKIAALLGHKDDGTLYSAKAAAVREAFNAALFHADKDEYDRGSQTANALPLALGLVPAGHEAGVLAHLVDDIHAHSDHVTAGDVGFHYVVRALTEAGRSDVLAAMMSRTDAPSYGDQLAKGATTLTEAWDTNPKDSQNHFMLGHGEEWFYRGLAGLRVDMARGPAAAIEVRPSLLHTVASASADFHAPMGVVSVAWHRTGLQAGVDVTVPPGAIAHVTLPRAAAWNEGGKPVKSAAGVVSAEEDGAALQIVVGSGTYHFQTATLQP